MGLSKFIECRIFLGVGGRCFGRQAILRALVKLTNVGKLVRIFRLGQLRAAWRDSEQRSETGSYLSLAATWLGNQRQQGKGEEGAGEFTPEPLFGF